jgi:hypothetical protein
VAVQGLVEVRAKHNFVRAAALSLHILHPFLVAWPPVQVCRRSGSKDATFCYHLLAAIHKLQGLSFAYGIFSAKKQIGF